MFEQQQKDQNTIVYPDVIYKIIKNIIKNKHN